MTERELRAQLGLLDHARVGDKLSCRSIEEYQAGSITGKLCRVFNIYQGTAFPFIWSS